ncbi:hypothetical protein [Pararhizobium sp.]|uniref:hypothetical protein n=1 Tax=Pararhizobium sp. TaxID=1977563 RepID=UPI002715C966|nr:hypothetical protein [Pararhizobium sp.]MDO9414934.1 hypothetical protein [Pararhizobium sp.]
MIKLIDPDHPFYRPLWVRLLIVGFCTAWTAMEFYQRQPFWGMIFLAVAAYTACVLLIFYKPPAEVPAETVAETKADITPDTPE